MEQSNIDNKEIRLKKLCKVSLIISIVITVSFMIFATAPFLSEAFGIFIYLMLGIGAVLMTICSLGVAWIDSDFRNKWESAFNFAKKIMEDGSIIAKAINYHVIWISIMLFILSSFGFIVNIINYKNYKNNKEKLIASIVCLGFALLALISSNIIYLAY